MNPKLSLDVASVGQIPGALRAAAQVFRENAGELVAAWSGDKAAGAPWDKVARVLERAADTLERPPKKRIRRAPRFVECSECSARDHYISRVRVAKDGETETRGVCTQCCDGLKRRGYEVQNA